MGTRHLIVVVSNGEYKIAQYGQFDGYPSGQGSSICEFIQNEMDLEKFRSAVNDCKFIGSSEVSKKWVECGANPNDAFVGMDVANKFGSKYPQLSREAGADILSLVQNGVRELKDSIDFAGDSLFCEWAYVFDLDNQVLEVYNGFNKSPLDEHERFYNLSYVREEAANDTAKEYYPVKLVGKFSFNDATSKAMCDLEKSLEEKDE